MGFDIIEINLVICYMCIVEPMNILSMHAATDLVDKSFGISKKNLRLEN